MNKDRKRHSMLKQMYQMESILSDFVLDYVDADFSKSTKKLRICVLCSTSVDNVKLSTRDRQEYTGHENLRGLE